MRRPFAYDLDHGVAKHDATQEAWIDSKEPANQPDVEYAPEQCSRCGEALHHGDKHGHQCS